MRTAIALLLFTSTAALAAPPEVPAPITAEVGKPVVFEVKMEKGKKFGFAPGFDKSKCVVVRLYTDDLDTAQFLAIPSAKGDFYLSFVTEGETKFSTLVIQVGKSPVNPPDNPPGPVATGPYYFVVVRPDGAYTPEFLAAIQLPQWDELKKAGHTWKEKTASEAALLGVKNLTAPAVAVLRVSPDGKTSNQVATLSMPYTGAAILALPNFAAGAKK